MAESILDFLIGDHRQFHKFFHDLDLLSRVPPLRRDDREAARRVADFQVPHRRHLRCESEILFPAVKEALESAQTCVGESSILNHLVEEHAVAGRTLYLLREQLSSRPPKVHWPRTFRILRRELTEHLQKEEEQLFPIASRLLGQEKLESMGQQADRARKIDATSEISVHLPLIVL